MLCGSFREGTLCGACQNSCYAPAYSFDMNCLQCNNDRGNLWKYMLRAFGPLTMFYFVLLFFQINVVSSRLMGFVFYNQVIALLVIIRECGSTLYVGLAHAVPPTNINFRLTFFLLTRLQGALYEDLPV